MKERIGVGKDTEGQSGKSIKKRRRKAVQEKEEYREAERKPERKPDKKKSREGGKEREMEKWARVKYQPMIPIL